MREIYMGTHHCI
ncbi:unnamed protein product [Larinioides sclopetarius]|uniref:Uncharacterized protein n=1 Tax=Larinioides sclopetarius TaxID=280406 RepID=A0AAV1YYH8_9ARAC